MRRPAWTRWVLSTVSSVALVLPPYVHAQSLIKDDDLQPRIEAGGRVGTERSLGVMEGWAPLVQDRDRVLYGDIRWSVDDGENQEGNLGIGYRQVVNDRVAGGEAIIGGHGWIDRRRTARGSTFYQITGGVEYLKEDWDLKANAYIPLNHEKEYTTPNLGTNTPYMAGTSLFVDTNGTILEEAQPGGDVEIGYRIPAFAQAIDAIRVYGGAYGFIGDRTDDVVGGRLRASIDVNPLLNVGARVQYDEPRGSQGFLEATLRFPFAAKKRFQHDRLRARLDESPERDIDIVTNSVSDSGLRKQVVNTASQQVQRVLHVDNRAAPGGDGSVETPFSTLAAAQSVLRDHDTLYIHEGDGTTAGMDQGLVIAKANVQLIGSGTDFVYDTGRFTTKRLGPNGPNGAIIQAATTAPLMTNNNVPVDSTDIYTGNGILITNDYASVSGVRVDGASFVGIRALADNQVLNSIKINDVEASNNGSTGIVAQVINNGRFNNVTITNSTSRNNNSIAAVTGNGISVSGSTNGSFGHVFVANNAVSNNSTSGLSLSTNTGSADSVVFQNNTITNNTGNGIGVTATNGVVRNLQIRNNTTNNHNGRGIIVQTQIMGQIDQLDIAGNTANANYGANGRGIELRAADGLINHARITDNVTAGNQLVGIYNVLTGADGRVNQVTISNNDASGNTGRGIYTNVTSGAQVGTLNIDNNTTNDNTDSNANGIQVEAGSGGNIAAVNVRNNTTSRNVVSGINLYANNGTFGRLLVQNNTVTDNTGVNSEGIYIISNNVTGNIGRVDILSNTITGNTRRGVYISTGTNSMIDQVTMADNVISGNSNGIQLQSTNANAVLSNVTVRNNMSSTNTSHGVYLLTGSSGSMSNLTFSDNITNDNVLHGLYAYANGGSIANVTLQDHTSSSNDQHGVVFQANSTGQFTNGRIDNLTSTDNGYDGLRFQTQSSSVMSASLSNSTLTGNGTAIPNLYYGVRIDYDSNNTFNVDLGGGGTSTGGNRIFNNAYRDVFVDTRPASSNTALGSVLSAQNNWWGTPAGLDQANRATFDNGTVGAANGSRIDASNPLSADPHP